MIYTFIVIGLLQPLQGLGGYIIVFAVVLALCFVGLAFNILFRKNGKFPETEVGSNRNMRKLGITCAKHDELKAHRKARQKKDTSAESCRYENCRPLN